MLNLSGTSLRLANAHPYNLQSTVTYTLHQNICCLIISQPGLIRAYDTLKTDREIQKRLKIDLKTKDERYLCICEVVCITK